MKTPKNLLSPFIILLVPVLLAILLTLNNSNSTLNQEKFEAASYFRMPSFNGLVRTFF
ncbi:hypothetical protein BDE36_0681 [Arcticibacter tournemirensis]|uniref:hypothetical protein n=1 Tax=Arcticibacter tournemirensis TaxID=699437 RepID=UPI00116F2324|nr:hypothetical protein [Arcticibacter tournemirensis]TQM48989.1 hypothetical protein BDE36_0681 [Arcticibacter tournemirensis]